VYLVYGSAYMLNVSSEIPGIRAGVLIRALEPRDGIPIMLYMRRFLRRHGLRLSVAAMARTSLNAGRESRQKSR